MINLNRWLRKIRCAHEDATFIRNIYGDQINHVSTSKVYRSWWKCNKCGKTFAKQYLVK